jgi:hypothetical protein
MINLIRHTVSCAQVCVRLFVVSNSNFMSASEDVSIAAYDKARGYPEYLAG